MTQTEGSAVATPDRPTRSRQHGFLARIRGVAVWPLRLKLGLVVLLVEVLAAVLASHLYPGDPFAMVEIPFLKPGEMSGYPLGTDLMGRDIAAQLLHGARFSLLVGLAATLIATVVGVTIGLLSGYFGGVIDHSLMRLTELFQVIPHFLLAITLVSILGATLGNIIIAIGITSWPMIARLVRAETLILRELDYVKISAVMGAGTVRVIVTHILPNALPPVVVAASLLTASAVLMECGLAFLGLSDVSRVSWGGMIGAAREALLDAPYMTLIPGAAIVLTVMALSLIGDGLNQLLNPRGHA
ncbi:ABC transporter permease [Neorhizobium sp. JUb45]|uniref:ABC transporter permease n=1 Tax=Neorhizobium sp. JUb45 TaxID=2485113 RepID=UPI00104EFA94|nr:ABC transporter permease [Neorhizobium sp. JUb45]TCQ99083.1 peptide/nickel transport system permease protein [Neorhizobium sp. JUb45]